MNPDLAKTCPQCGRETTIFLWIALDRWICDTCHQSRLIPDNYKPDQTVQ